MRIVDSMLGEIDQEAATTRRVLARVPENQLTWKPHAKSMSLGELALHIAMTPGLIAQFVAKDTFEMTGFKQPEATSSAELMAALDTSVAQAKATLNGFDDAAMGRSWSMIAGGKTVMTMPRAAVVRFIMLNHWYHHRGQLSVYLRLLGVAVPSIYGPSADENPFS